MTQRPFLLTSDFDYHLPEELIASEPLPRRSDSRLLVVNRATQTLAHHHFRDLPNFITPGDLLVLNDTRVVPARFFSNDQSKELLRLQAFSPTSWRCMVRPGRKLRAGDTIVIGGATGAVSEIYENGDRRIDFDQPVDEDRHGHLALPPYMHRQDRAEDKERYQTVFARHSGSIAAPTAGLHFTPELLAAIPHTFVTLHVGVGTFQPVKAERVQDHTMHAEHYALSPESASQIHAARRVIAVGTTATRVLESIAAKHGHPIPGAGSTDIFIHPPYQFRVIDALITNFHLPKSTLLMLVCAFAGKELIFEAYREAIREKYRFYSYGDGMLIL